MLPEPLLARLRTDLVWDKDHQRLAPPHDPEAWALYADALLDAGDPRGELIHERLAVEAGNRDRAQYEARVKQAEGKNPFWREGLRRDAAPFWSDGFIVGLHIGLRSAQQGLHEWIQHPNSPWLVSLFLRGTSIQDAGCRALTSLKALEGFTCLDLGYHAISSEGIHALVDVPTQDLRELDLRYNVIGDEGLEVLSRHSRFFNLTRLDIRSNRIGISGSAKLAESQFFQLRSLHLEDNRIGEEGAKRLADAPPLAKLQRLGLTLNAIGKAGVQALLNSPHLRSVHTLDLQHNNVRDDGVRTLVEATNSGGLISLDLQSNRIGDVGAKILAEASCLQSLRFLGLGKNYITDDGALALAHSPHLCSLVTLDLDHNRISPKAQHALAQRGWR